MKVGLIVSNVDYSLQKKRTGFIIVEVTDLKNIFSEVIGPDTWGGIGSRENERRGIED